MKKTLLLSAFFVSLSFWTWAQQIEISGTVKSAMNKLPLPGATIQIKGTFIGTTTDADGKYTIKASPAEILVFSSMGMVPSEVTITSGTKTINIVLQESAINLEEVMVVGYGSKQKNAVTGAISKIDSTVFETRPLTNTLNALQGAIPGVTVIRGSGQPGRENYEFQIRGYSSINGNKPLILIDGMTSDINTLNPNDIASVTVLKDAAASIYGARAADGVVLITTKNGKKGSPTITYSMNYGIKKPAYLKKMATTLELAEMLDEGLKNIGQPGVSADVFDKIRNNAPPDPNGGWNKYLESYPGFYQTIDWNKELFSNGQQQTHNISISGGGDDNTYLFSAGYANNTGVFKVGENKSDRYNLRMNYDFKLFNKVSIQTRNSFDDEVVNEPSQLGTALWLAHRVWSYQPVYNSIGEFYTYQGYYNPVQTITEGGTRTSNSNRFSTNIKAEIKIIQDLKLTGQAGLNFGNYNDDANFRTYNGYDWTGGIQGIANSPNSANVTNNRNLYKTYTAYLDYSKSVFTNHRLGIMAGTSHEENVDQGNTIYGSNFISNDIFTLNLADRTKAEYTYITGFKTDWALSSYFGRFSYAFMNRFYLDATLRMDGSSKFSPEKRWSAAFPAVSAAWNLSEENFIKSLKVIDNLKLRASWGRSGNQDISTFGNYDYIPLVSFGGVYPIGSPNAGLTGATSSIASTSRTWETIESKNIGLDFAILKSRLTGNFDYFIKENKNMLVNSQVPVTLGGTPPSQNLGHLVTKGWELSLSWKDNIGDFKYSITGGISDSKNKLVELKGNDVYYEGLNYAHQGYSLYTYFGYAYDGIIQNADQLAKYKNLGGIPSNIGIGDVMYKDVDGDGQITAYGDPTKGTKGDMIALGNLLPRYTFSSNMSASFKNFDVSVFLQGVGKSQGMREGDFRQPFMAVWYQPMEYFYGKSWTPENPNAKYPRIIPGGLGFEDLKYYNWRSSSMRIERLAYLRIKVITLGYNIPASVCKKIKLNSMKVYVSGQDLFTFSKGTWNKAFDPEEGWQRSDEQTYPFNKVISVGLDVKF